MSKTKEIQGIFPKELNVNGATRMLQRLALREAVLERKVEKAILAKSNGTVCNCFFCDEPIEGKIGVYKAKIPLDLSWEGKKVSFNGADQVYFFVDEECFRTVEGYQLIKENYGYVDRNSAKNWVLDYVDQNTTLLNRDVLFIKKFMKVVRNISKQREKSLEPHLEKLFVFGMEGYKKSLDPNLEEVLEPSDNIKIKAHLLKDASIFAKLLYNQSYDPAWAKKCYETNKLAAELTKDSETEFSGVSFFHAAQSLQSYFFHSLDHDAIDNIIHCCDNSSRLLKGFDSKRYSGLLYSAEKIKKDTLKLKV